MTDTRQYITAQFRAGSGIAYTYHNDGPPVAVGDEVKLPAAKGDGWSRGYVAAVDVAKPTKFDTKPIDGLAPKEELKDA